MKKLNVGDIVRVKMDPTNYLNFFRLGEEVQVKEVLPDGTLWVFAKGLDGVLSSPYHIEQRDLKGNE